MGVSETWFHVNIQKVQILKDWSDLAWDILIFINGVHIQYQQRNGDKIRTKNFFSQDYCLNDHIWRKMGFHDKIQFLVTEDLCFNIKKCKENVKIALLATSWCFRNKNDIFWKECKFLKNTVCDIFLAFLHIEPNWAIKPK